MQYVQKLSAGRSETLPRCDCKEWEVEVGQVLGCLAFQTAVHHVLDSLKLVTKFTVVTKPVKADMVLFAVNTV